MRGTVSSYFYLCLSHQLSSPCKEAIEVEPLARTERVQGRDKAEIEPTTNQIKPPIPSSKLNQVQPPQRARLLRGWVLRYARILVARPRDGYDMFSPRDVRGVEKCAPATGYDELRGGWVDLGFLRPRHRRGAREAWFPRVVAVPLKRRDGETERRRDGETERRRDGEKDEREKRLIILCTVLGGHHNIILCQCVCSVPRWERYKCRSVFPCS
jgi:hypothetical protein